MSVPSPFSTNSFSFLGLVGVQGHAPPKILKR